MRAGKQFVADDCMGLAQQVAFSALLAFLPTVVLLIGLLGLFRHRGLQRGRALRRERRPDTASRDVIDPGQEGRSRQQAGLGDRLRRRHDRRDLGRERRDGRGDQGREPRLTTASRRGRSGSCA